VNQFKNIPHRKIFVRILIMLPGSYADFSRVMVEKEILQSSSYSLSTNADHQDFKLTLNLTVV